MPYGPEDFDLYEKEACYLVDPPEDPAESYEEPEICPVRIEIFARANNLAEISRKLSEHRWEYCAECGQTEFMGYEPERRVA